MLRGALWSAIGRPPYSAAVRYLKDARRQALSTIGLTSPIQRSIVSSSNGAASSAM